MIDDEGFDFNDDDLENEPLGVSEILDDLEKREDTPTITFLPDGLIRIRTPDKEVEHGKQVIPVTLMCPACGWPVSECDVHDDEDLEIIRLHEAGVHDRCDVVGCKVAAEDDDRRAKRGF